MARRARTSAPRRGSRKSTSSRGLLVLAGLGLVAAAAVVALTQLDPPPAAGRGGRVAPEVVPGIEAPEQAARSPAAPAALPAPTPTPKPPPVLTAAAPAAPDARPDRIPRVAIVLDDCGQRLDLLQRAARIRQPLTFAVIPHLRHSRASAEAAHAAGHEVIVHQPMEPESGEEDPGRGVLHAGMSRGDVARTLRESFRDVPHAAGLNNHMGSRATSDEGLMAAMAEALAGRDPGRAPYFLDSRTSARTVALQAARSAGLRVAERDVFLDNDLSEAAILAQMDALLAEAAAQGSAVGIGHLKPETLGVLEAVLPQAEGRQARFVFLGDLVR